MADKALAARIRGDVVQLAWPAMLQGLVATVVFFTDRLLLGHYSTAAIGALGLAGPFLWSIASVFGAYDAGVVAVIGRAIGAGDGARARATVRAVLRFAALSGLLVGALLFATRRTVVQLLAGSALDSPAVLDQAAEYMAIVCMVAPLQFAAATGNTALQASGDTKTPMLIAAITGALNLVISWLLVYGHLGLPEMGVRGAALGTAAAFSMQFVMVIACLAWRSGTLSIRWRPGDMRPTWRSALAPVLRVSTRAFGERVIFHSAYVSFIALIGHLGELALAAHQVILAIESISFIAAAGLGIASGALVAQKLGGGRPDEAMLVGRIAARLGALALGAVALVFLFIPERCVALLSNDPEVIKLGARCLRIAAVAQPLMAVAEAFSGGLRGAGDTASPMWAALIGPVLVRMTACFVLAYPLGLGLTGIWIGSTLDWMVRSFWLMRAFLIGRWRTITV